MLVTHTATSERAARSDVISAMGTVQITHIHAVTRPHYDRAWNHPR